MPSAVQLVCMCAVNRGEEAQEIKESSFTLIAVLLPNSLSTSHSSLVSRFGALIPLVFVSEEARGKSEIDGDTTAADESEC